MSEDEKVRCPICTRRVDSKNEEWWFRYTDKEFKEHINEEHTPYEVFMFLNSKVETLDSIQRKDGHLLVEILGALRRIDKEAYEAIRKPNEVEI
ncbi:hypothetical protein AKJ58_00165 [candidate division MSBL1 archaeon SCGC-AAA385D11]|uniref:Uncharacterized protein n=1 Tax=candidate division MSBL1 archaeon SCGC-AAA385D11 TaxID=1698286 RepID=A0A133VPI1_9EURY|nr:hypothetical protein AKJ58_00165 [candidate division MSBL1 archaeon SCGC-AAA385D11]